MVHKKSQISLFILFGAVILIVAGFLFYTEQKTGETKTENINEVSLELEPIENFVRVCIRDTAKKSMLFIGKQGGYFELKKPYLKDDNFNLPYYFYEDSGIVPSAKDIEKEISKYINNNLPTCINNFEEFRKLGFEIEYQDISANVMMGQDSVSFSVNFPLIIKKDGSIHKIENFVVTIYNMPLRKINNLSKEIINLQLQDKDSICLSCLYDLGEKNDLFIDITEYLDNTLIFDLRAYNTDLGISPDTPYNFTFAVKHKGMSCDNLAAIDDFIFITECIEAKKEELSTEIIVENIPDFGIKVGEEFFYDINATGKNLIFEDFTDLFEIDKLSGIVKFTPKDEQIGLHQIWITVFDLNDNKNYGNFEINITK